MAATLEAHRENIPSEALSRVSAVLHPNSKGRY